MGAKNGGIAIAQEDRPLPPTLGAGGPHTGWNAGCCDQRAPGGSIGVLFTSFSTPSPREEDDFSFADSPSAASLLLATLSRGILPFCCVVATSPASPDKRVACCVVPLLSVGEEFFVIFLALVATLAAAVEEVVVDATRRRLELEAANRCCFFEDDAPSSFFAVYRDVVVPMGKRLWLQFWTDR